MLLKIYPENPSQRQIQTVVDCLNKGGLVIFPTDTVYGLGCSLYQQKSADKMAQVVGIKKEKVSFSFIFNNLSMLSEFTKPISNEVYKLMRKNLPGPFTFIVEGNNNIPKIFHNKKRTVGIRIPDNEIVAAITERLGHPLLTTSIHHPDEIVEYMTDPEEIQEIFGRTVDIIIDGGFGGNQPSTIVDCTGDECEITRQGKGILQ
jgi:tRNA threonylcarbamoyl adenosine modification protein (Sua5/YciO/YrdC/YwlC family)